MSANLSDSSVPPPPTDVEEVYACIGVCMADAETGLCQGCGRPLAEPEPPEPDGNA